MIKIKETQYVFIDKNSYQTRIIKYDSWMEYINDISIPDGQKYNKSSFPRQTQIRNLDYSDNKLNCFFMHRLVHYMGEPVGIYHEAEIV